MPGQEKRTRKPVKIAAAALLASSAAGLLYSLNGEPRNNNLDFAKVSLTNQEINSPKISFKPLKPNEATENYGKNSTQVTTTPPYQRSLSESGDEQGTLESKVVSPAVGQGYPFSFFFSLNDFAEATGARDDCLQQAVRENKLHDGTQKVHKAITARGKIESGTDYTTMNFLDRPIMIRETPIKNLDFPSSIIKSSEDGNSYTITGATARELLSKAFNIPEEFIDVDDSVPLVKRYDLIVNAQGEDITLQLQKAVTNILGVNCTRTTERLPANVLTVGNLEILVKTPQERRNDPPHMMSPEISDDLSTGTYRYRSHSMKDIAQQLSAVNGLPLTDGTELEGKYDFDISVRTDKPFYELTEQETQDALANSLIGSLDIRVNSHLYPVEVLEVRSAAEVYKDDLDEPMNEPADTIVAGIDPLTGQPPIEDVVIYPYEPLGYDSAIFTSVSDKEDDEGNYVESINGITIIGSIDDVIRIASNVPAKDIGFEGDVPQGKYMVISRLSGERFLNGLAHTFNYSTEFEEHIQPAYRMTADTQYLTPSTAPIDNGVTMSLEMQNDGIRFRLTNGTLEDIANALTSVSEDGYRVHYGGNSFQTDDTLQRYDIDVVAGQPGDAILYDIDSIGVQNSLIKYLASIGFSFNEENQPVTKVRVIFNSEHEEQ